MSYQFRKALRDHVLNSSAVTARVSQRMYPLQLPQAPTYPAIVYQIVSDETVMNLNETARPRAARVQIDCWATDPDEAARVADDVRDQLDGAQTTVSSVRIAVAEHANVNDLFDDSVRHYRVSADYEITYWEV